MSNARPPLLILGASGRAAAASAWRAGFNPTVVDLFADRDLVARFPAIRIDRAAYPLGLEAIAATLPDSPWIYTGAIENHPALIDRIARSRPLLGNGGDALRAARDPLRWTKALRDAGLPALPIRLPGDPPPTQGRWLLKPLRSASGRGIGLMDRSLSSIPADSYLQRRVAGRPLSAVFIGEAGGVRGVGITRQRLGINDRGLKMAYLGTLAPALLPGDAAATIARIGSTLASSLGLLGLFGVDLVLDDSTPYVVEINPRYTASVETIETCSGLDLLVPHARTFGLDARVGRAPARPALGFAAKHILYAHRASITPADWPWTDPRDPHPRVADLPAPGTAIAPGDPVLTVFSKGRTEAETLAQLRARVALWRRRIEAWMVRSQT